MKYILIIGLLIAAFVSGIYFENSRLVGEPDKTIAVMLSKQAIENSSFQLKENSEYLNLIQNKEYDRLAVRIRSNSELLTGIQNSAESVCSQVTCSDEEKAYIVGAKKNGS